MKHRFKYYTTIKAHPYIEECVVIRMRHEEGEGILRLERAIFQYEIDRANFDLMQFTIVHMEAEIDRAIHRS